MSEFTQLLVNVDNKLEAFIIAHQQLRIENKCLRKDFEALKEQLIEKEQQIEALENQLEKFRIASAISGSDNYKHETKIKINTLVREIDNCIAQLSK